jgi:hypothetical protein
MHCQVARERCLNHTTYDDTLLHILAMYISSDSHVPGASDRVTVNSGKVDIIEVRLKHGTAIDHRNNHGRTPDDFLEATYMNYQSNSKVREQLSKRLRDGNKFSLEKRAMTKALSESQREAVGDEPRS